jgi:pimeloyl-ACP methyl ester carboxylesterase
MEAGFTQGIVRVDGASIYYERRGDGPALLLISAGQGDAAGFTPVADLLAGDYTVLTFDRRGVGRSRWQGPKRQFSLLQQAEDAAAVITANGFESASVVGCSSGATIVLEMVAACPAAVSRAVAYEPPVISGLPDRGELFDFYDHLEALAVEGRAFEALAEHLRRCGLPSLIPDPPPAPGGEQLRSIENFVKDDMQVVTYYRPDYARLIASEVPLVIAYGRDSLDLDGSGQPVFTVRAAQAAAKRIGVEAVEFPGNHILQAVDPPVFADALRPLLRPANDNATRGTNVRHVSP